MHIPCVVILWRSTGTVLRLIYRDTLRQIKVKQQQSDIKTDNLEHVKQPVDK